MVLLLGATGLLGRNVLQVLLERGIEVRALVRSSLDVPGVDIVRGRILSKDDLMAAACGCSAIINCAGTTVCRETNIFLYKINHFKTFNKIK